MGKDQLLDRITVRPDVFGGKPIIRERRLAVHVLEMLAAGDTSDAILAAYPWLEPDDLRACFACARGLVSQEKQERSEPEAVEASV
jgi:uncharacterized protein (DUF433 family)